MKEEKIVWNIGKEGMEELKNNEPPCFMTTEPSKSQRETERKEWVVGWIVRVRPEVENALRLFADKTGWLPHTVRNVAILAGLIALAKGQAKFPESVGQYEKLLKEAVKAIEGLDYGKEENK